MSKNSRVLYVSNQCPICKHIDDRDHRDLSITIMSGGYRYYEWMDEKQGNIRFSIIIVPCVTCNTPFLRIYEMSESF